ncbi:hypothetical protein [Streptomyces sp.]|uniref:hypothetical protein n=1 Tax=Streptomyces sp. TaxID=1931 RepID=UPI002F42DE99
MTIQTLPRHARTGVLAVGWRKARTGEDPHELHPIWPILGGAEDEDSQEQGEDDAGKDESAEEDESGQDDAAEEESGQDEDDGADKLGDAGKQALDRMKAKLRDERGKRRAAESERDQLKAKSVDDKPDQDQIRAEADKAATAKANKRIIRSEVKAAATGKLAKPADALVFLDLDQFEVDGDGQVDEDEVAEAIENLLTDRPYLAVTVPKQPRFQGTGDGGARKGTGGPKQLSEQEVKKLTPEQIDDAHRKGQLRDYLGG